MHDLKLLTSQYSAFPYLKSSTKESSVLIYKDSKIRSVLLPELRTVKEPVQVPTLDHLHAYAMQLHPTQNT